jgi:hypothetical protein
MNGACRRGSFDFPEVMESLERLFEESSPQRDFRPHFSAGQVRAERRAQK